MRKRYLLAALAITGCQSAPAYIVYKPGVDLNTTQAAKDQCKIDSFKEIPQSLATDVNPGYSNPGTIQCNTYGTMTTCNRVGAVNIPASSTTYDVNDGLRDRYITRCLEAKGFGVKLARSCASKAEEDKALADRAAGQFPECAVSLPQ
ncbi:MULTISPECIES: hypothetical protein [unclassified Mesorhizobium]|uniref:hypothetical protein n=1 Tax=unclassified Mesorhizobium TaxID=325217 RepID=UPI0004CFA711|nr:MULTISPECIES: hypothetical protein [unclassified Mesorhizobium]WJI80807.1 hypothetical protein NLY34_28975 [Mesorhizobium sp. C374B]WJI87346.1 hypothetical protein NLY42_31370 [Mesorhizobium sp. C372A]